MTRPPSLERLESAAGIPLPDAAGTAPGPADPARSTWPAVHPCWPWLDALALAAAAVAWQQIIAWSSWVWLLPGAAATIALAAVLVGAGRWAVRALPPNPPVALPARTDSGPARRLGHPLINPLLLGLITVVSALMLGWHALWVIPGDMVGLGVLAGLLAVIHVSQQVPERWWPLRLLLNGAIVGALILLTSLQPMAPMVRAFYLTALVALAIMAARSRGHGFSALVPREVFGAAVFALGVGIAPHFMANSPPDAWVGREFLACLLVIALSRVCLSAAVLPTDPRQAVAADPVAWVSRWPALRTWLPVLLVTGFIAGGLLLADPAGRSRWIGAAVMLSVLWMAPAAMCRATRDPDGRSRHVERLLLPAWIAIGPVIGPAAVWWFRGWIG